MVQMTTIQKHADRSLSFIDDVTGEYVIDNEKKFDDFFNCEVGVFINRIVEFAIQEFPKFEYRSVNSKDECVYRLFDENDEVCNKCIIGRLIPDDIYNKDIEGSTGSQIFMILGKVQQYSKIFESKYVYEIVKCIQRVHDYYAGYIPVTKNSNWFHEGLKREIINIYNYGFEYYELGTN